MDLHLETRGNQSFLVGAPDTRLLASPDDVVDLIGACFEHKARSHLLYAENLPEHFFDLSSGEAGTILQKLRNYRIKMAVVAPPDSVRQSTMFRGMAREESKGGDLRVFDDRPSAEAWLAGN